MRATAVTAAIAAAAASVTATVAATTRRAFAPHHNLIVHRAGRHRWLPVLSVTMASSISVGSAPLEDPQHVTKAGPTRQTHRLYQQPATLTGGLELGAARLPTRCGPPGELRDDSETATPFAHVRECGARMRRPRGQRHPIGCGAAGVAVRLQLERRPAEEQRRVLTRCRC